MSIKYFNSFELPNKWVLSCDMVRINFELNVEHALNIMTFYKNPFNKSFTIYPDNFQAHKYRYLTKVSFDEESSFSIGIGFNANGFKAVLDEDTNKKYFVTDYKDDNDQFGQRNEYKGFIEFNPNKVCQFSQFWSLYNELRSSCDLFIVKRCDIALDIPISREKVVLVKDQRHYALDAYSLENRTEYLGRRNNVGFVKVYNKSLESELSGPLTRIEVTTEFDAERYLSHFPKIYSLDFSEQLGLDFMSLNESDTATVLAFSKLMLLQADEGMLIFNSLAQNKKKKLKPFVLPESSCFTLSNLAELVRNYFVDLRALLRL